MTAEICWTLSSPADNPCIAAARERDFDALIVLLQRGAQGRPRAEARRHSIEVHGAQAVASWAMTFSRVGLQYKPVLINGTPSSGLLCIRHGQLFSVIGFTITAGRITEMNILADPDRLKHLDLSAFDKKGVPPQWSV